MTDPIPMILWCPACDARHIDTGVFATKPHHTHACQSCGVNWKPALVPTVGVQFLPGCGPAEASTQSFFHDDSNTKAVPQPSTEDPRLGLLLKLLKFKLPQLEIKMDLEPLPEKVAYIDLKAPDGRNFLIEAYVGANFGLSELTQDTAYGEGADELYDTAQEVVRRLLDVVKNGELIIARKTNELRELRIKSGLSMKKMAERLGVTVPTIWDFEREICVNSEIRAQYEGIK